MPQALAGNLLGLVGVLLILAQGAWDLYIRWSHERLRRKVEGPSPAGVRVDTDLAALNRQLLDDYERRMRRYHWWQTVLFVVGAALLLCSYGVQIAVNAGATGT